MNRINLSPLASSNGHEELGSSKAPQNRKTLFPWDSGEARAESEVSVFAPLHYEKNYSYPAIVWLHSDGQSSSQLETIMTSISVQNYVGVAPQAPIGNFQCGYFWEQDFDSIRSADASVSESIDLALSRFNVDRSRVFLAGSEGGGTMALRVALRRPDQFAGVITLNGPMPSGQSPLVQWSRCRNMPIFWGHCIRGENGSQQQEMCDQFRFLYSTGFLNVSTREYPTQQHLEHLAPAAINRWIMEQIHSAIL